MRTYFTTVIFIFFILSCNKHKVKDFEKSDMKSLSNLSDDLYISREYIMKYKVYKQLQDLNEKRPFIESLIKKHANSLVLQIKKFSEEFSKQENGIIPTVFVFGDYVQKFYSGSQTTYYGSSVSLGYAKTDDYLKINFEDKMIVNPLLSLTSELDEQGRLDILEPRYRFHLRKIYDIDMYPVIYNLYISHKQPSIYLIGNKIYKKQNEIGNNIYYRKTLKLDVIKNSNEWILQPKEKENWEIDLSINERWIKNVSPDYVYKIKSYHLESEIHEEMFNSYLTVPNVFSRPMCDISQNEKEQVDRFIEDNLEFLTQEIHRYSKDFSKIEDGIKELRILSRYKQVIPFDEIINNNYFHIYAAFYNMYFIKNNPKVLIVGNKNHKMKDNSGTFYNNAIVLNIDKKFDHNKIKISQEPLLEQVPVEPVTLNNDIINKCESCKLYLSENDSSEIHQYLLKQNIYQEIKNAKRINILLILLLKNKQILY
ncbi:Hypothetical protein BCD_1368 (plasmid) [Borrelia crocidurae DOU]|uniref:Lipoprotein n=1 Tax=Borrelia crocidurae DOU TaxID=1293575 RepID=W5SJY4_9SPIR|nr:hypothetical protein [Borrelia crocidurae]AHH07434.1 Hypothetical protein BCD_1368 [Borrelia crocidurae DOU]